MSEKMLIFQMTSDTALEFWERVHRLGLKTERERKAVLLELAREGKITSVVETGRTKEQIVQDYAKHYNVVSITGKENETVN